MVENARGARLLIVNLLGRIFMEALDDPFAALDRELSAARSATAARRSSSTSTRRRRARNAALGHFADGRASLVAGTHTHVPSADHRILAGGTGFVTDVGMTGDYDSVIGMEKDEPLRRFTRRIPSGRFEPAMGPATLCAVAVDIGPDGLTAANRARAHRRPPRRDRNRSSGAERRWPAPTIVYDLDGTLADTAGDLMGALNFVLEREGLATLPVENARSLLGAGGRALIQRGFAASGHELSPEKLEMLFGDFLAHYNKHIAVHTPLYPGVLAALDAFEAAGWAQAICTNKMEASAQEC